MEHDRQIIKISNYISNKYGTHQLTREQVAKELLTSAPNISRATKEGTLKSYHVDSVATYIITKEKDARR